MTDHTLHPSRSGFARTLLAMLTLVGLVLGIVATDAAVITPRVASAADTAVLGLAKNIVETGPFTKGQAFTYRFGYACSSNTEAGCPNAKLVDVLPAGVEPTADAATIAATLSNTRRTVTYDAGTKTFTVVFIDQLATVPAVVLGLAVGDTVSFDLAVKVSNDVVDGQALNNCADLTADNAAAKQSCANTTASVPKTASATLTKTLTPNSGVASTDPTSTALITAGVTGDLPATSLTVVDPAPGTASFFEQFNVVSYGPLTPLPAGVTGVQVFLNGSATADATYAGPIAAAVVPTDAANVTSITFVYTGTINPGTTVAMPLDVQLRDARRSDSVAIESGTFTNAARVTATFTGKPDVTPPDATATYTVIPRTPVADGSKAFIPATAQQNSDAVVVLELKGKNASQVPATQMVVTDPTGGNPFTIFDFTSFKPLALPQDVTAKVEVKVGPNPTDWITLGTNYAPGATPLLTDADPDVNPAAVIGVKYTYNGPIAVNATITNSINLTLRDNNRDAPGNPVVAQLYTNLNCMTVDVSNSLYQGAATKSGICAPFTVTSPTVQVQGDKKFYDISTGTGTTNNDGAVGQSDEQTDVRIRGGNAGTSTIGITNLVITEPGTGSDPTFVYFDFVSFGTLIAPDDTAWKIEVRTNVDPDLNDNWTQVATGLVTGSPAPALPMGITAGQVTGIRYTQVAGTLGIGKQLEARFRLQLRDNERTVAATSINYTKTITNKITVASGTTTTNPSDTFKVEPQKGGTAGANKTLGPDSVVAHSAATANVTLSGTASGSNVPLDKIVLEDTPVTPSTKFWTYFDFASFTNVNVAAGQTLKVEVYSTTVSDWVTVGTYTANVTGATLNAALPTAAGNVAGVKFTFTGTFAAGATTTVNAGFTATLRETTREATPQQIDGTPSVENCLQVTTDGPLTQPALGTSCKTIAITSIAYKVKNEKSFDPTSSISGIGSPNTTATLLVKNSGNIGLKTITALEPNTVAPNASPNAFTHFKLTGFGAVELPVGTQVLIETAVGGSFTTVGTYTNGQTPGSFVGDPTQVKLTFSKVAANALIPADDVMRVPLTMTLRDPLTPGSFENCFAVSATATQNVVLDDQSKPCASYQLIAQAPGAAITKTWSADGQVGTPESPVKGFRDLLPSSTITLNANVSGNIAATSLIVTDPVAITGTDNLGGNPFDAFTFTGFGTFAFPSGIDRVQVDALKTTGWVTGAVSSSSSLALPAGVDAADVIGFRFTFTKNGGTVPTGDASKVVIPINVTLRAALRSTGEVVPTGSINNYANAGVTSVGHDPVTTNNVNASYLVEDGTVTLVPDKRIFGDATGNSIPAAEPNEVVTFQLQLKNTGTKNWINPVVVDKFLPTLVYDAFTPYNNVPGGQFLFVPGTSSLVGPVTVTESPTGTLTFAFPAGAYLAPGETAFINLKLKVAPGTPANTSITNTYGVSVAGGGQTCAKGGSTSFVPGQTFCTDSQQVTVKTAKNLSSLKEIKGTTPELTNIVTPGGACPNSGGFTYYPCVAHTETGGIFDYRLTVSNSSNVAFDRAVVIDKLPAAGDTGVIVNLPRLTEWTPTLSGAVNLLGVPAGTSSKVWYSVKAAPCLTPITDNTGPAFTACGNDWTDVNPGPTTTHIAVEVTYLDGKNFKPLDSFRLEWKMQAPAVTPGAMSVAWNSFAYTGRPAGEARLLLPAEPRKVGIVLDNPTVQVNKTTVPVTSGAKFDFTLVQTGTTPAVPGTAIHSVTTSGTGAGSTTPWTNLKPGGTYQLTESVVSGWTPSVFTCVDANRNNAPVTISADGTFTAPAGAAIVCSMENSKQPIVTVKKTSVGGDGTFQFTLTPTAPAGTALPKDVTTVGGTGTASFGPVTIGTTYTLAETGLAAWESTLIGCVDTSKQGNPPVGTRNGNVATLPTLAAGSTIECSFTNSLKPTVNVIKYVDGQSSGTFEFTLVGPTIDPKDTTHEVDAGPFSVGDTSWTLLQVGGSYTISEGDLAAWEESFDGCANVATEPATDIEGTNGEGGFTFTAPAGAVIECSFTNAEKPFVSVNKSFEGATVDQEFTFTLTGPAGDDSAAAEQTVSPTDPFATWDNTLLVVGGTYTLAETVDSGWVSTFTGCVNYILQDGPSLQVPFGSADENGVVTLPELPAGADIVCSFTNTKRPIITVEKTSVGGTGDEDFTFTLTGDETNVVDSKLVDLTGGSGEATWGPENLTPGGTFTLAESAADAWVSQFVECVDVSGERFTSGTEGLVAPGDGDTATPFAVTVDENGTVTLANVPAGAHIVCSFVNTQRPTVAVSKTVDGTLAGETFPFTLVGLQGASVPNGQTTKVWDPASATPSAAWNDGLTPGGQYLLTELATAGWTPTFTSCTGAINVSSAINGDGSLSVLFNAPAGADIVCSFVNTRNVESSPPTVPPAPTTTQPVVTPTSVDQGGPLPIVPGSNLPSTGSDVMRIIQLALLALFAGAAMVMVRRRRKAA